VVGLKQLVCQKCASHKVKIVMFETEGKRFAVCDDCGNVQTIGRDLRERYGKWMQRRESVSR
jgi:hypothetical protein